ncbi:UNVERIFIED_CONTAM: hypothetical protein GTU68_018115 [Idotea baltica]|nr:hypothetical protein [Idotea baltica]
MSSTDKTNKVIVVYDETTKDVTINLRYVNAEFNIDRYFNFQRKSTESCGRVLGRMSDNIVKIIAKKMKKRGSKPVEIKVTLVTKEDGKEYDVGNQSCLEAFIKTNKNNLRIGSEDYSFLINPPLLMLLELPKKNIMAGFLVYPSKLEGLNCDVKDTILKWYRSKEKFETYKMTKNYDLKTLDWEEVGEGLSFLTSVDDVSRLLKVVGTPYKGNIKGIESESIFNSLISAGPGPCPFEKRHMFTSEILDKKYLRVLSYNILADMYADSDYSRTTLFPSCPPYALEIEYRKQLFIKEIIGYKADLICLQEVDEKVFLRDLQPVLLNYGLEGVFKTKGGPSVSEGLATFYRTDKMILKDKYNFLLCQELQINPLFGDLLKKVRLSPNLYEAFLKRTTIVQVNVFARRECPTQLLVVGVTHLYFDPISDHIRLLQAGMCLTLLTQIMDIIKHEDPRNDVSLLFCGDFNSVPENAVYRLMTSQLIDEKDEDWRSKPGEELRKVSFSHDLEIGSACGTPAYTNYTLGFQGCLDYIFYQSDKFSVKQMIPFPSHEEVTQHGALPSITFPSDHIALVADLEWK